MSCALTDSPPRFELCFEVEDTDAASAHLLALGVKQLQPPTDQPWGERNAYFEDPDGYPLELVEVAYYNGEERRAGIAAYLASRS